MSCCPWHGARKKMDERCRAELDLRPFIHGRRAFKLVIWRSRYWLAPLVFRYSAWHTVALIFATIRHVPDLWDEIDLGHCGWPLVSLYPKWFGRRLDDFHQEGKRRKMMAVLGYELLVTELFIVENCTLSNKRNKTLLSFFDKKNFYLDFINWVFMIL